MQKLTIKNLGPISDCSIEIRDFMVFTGPQASGKSTLAKSIFFFNHLKNILFSMYQKQMATKPLFKALNLETSFAKKVQKVFLQSFGIGTDSKKNGTVSYYYDNGCSIVVMYESCEDGANIAVTFDDEMKRNLQKLEQMLNTNDRKDTDKIRKFIFNGIFASDMDTVYIPAGRSMLTVLSSQVNYLYSVMDDRIRAMMDYCTQQFLENVLLLKDYFNKNYDSLLKQTLEMADYEIDADKAKLAVEMMRDILGGEYRAVNGEERLYYSENYVKINYASSGQQEAAWIVNMLFYYMLGKRKTFFIVEEPESHLFPETQKAVVELISLVKNGSNKVLITTHSPYILGSINNLLYAKKISNDNNKDRIEKIIPSDIWLDYDAVAAYFLENGKLEDIKDDEFADAEDILSTELIAYTSFYRIVPGKVRTQELESAEYSHLLKKVGNKRLKCQSKILEDTLF